MYYIIPGKAIRKLEKMGLKFQERTDVEYDSFYVETYSESKKLKKKNRTISKGQKSLLGII